MTLLEKLVALHLALDDAQLPHAFGGALALAWCTEAARATIDIDVNLFVDASAADRVFAALPSAVVSAVTTPAKALEELKRDTQIRLWWHNTPIDIFLNSTPFHADVAGRVRWEQLADHSLPFLCCSDLAVFKAFYNRTKDWADLEEMHAAGTLNVELVAATLTEYLGADDERLRHLKRLQNQEKEVRQRR